VVIEDSLYFIGEVFLLTHVLIIDVVKVLPTALMRFIGQPHLYLSLLLLQGKSIDDRFLLGNRHSFYFFLTSRFLFSFDGPFGFDFGGDLERFFLFGHGRLIECFDDIVLHHEGLDLVLEVGLPDIHKRVHLLNSSLSDSEGTM
jgi:hypothetical protein